MTGSSEIFLKKSVKSAHTANSRRVEPAGDALYFFLYFLLISAAEFDFSLNLLVYSALFNLNFAL